MLSRGAPRLLPLRPFSRGSAPRRDAHTEVGEGSAPASQELPLPFVRHQLHPAIIVAEISRRVRGESLHGPWEL